VENPMKLNKKSIRIFLALVLTTAIMMVTVIAMAIEEKDKHNIIAKLNEQVQGLAKDVSYYENLREKEKTQVAFRQFKESVFKLRYPDFSEIIKIVFKESKKYGFNPYLVMAVIQVESGFDPFAVSTAGAYGLMQVNYSVWKDELKIDFNRIFEKEYNIDLGLRILKHYYDGNAGNLFMALFRYNNGYKYNNTRYSGKVTATRFYAHRNKAEKAANQQKNLQI
jgi:soluble lytic murein transglycosylase-like protein